MTSCIIGQNMCTLSDHSWIKLLHVNIQVDWLGGPLLIGRLSGDIREPISLPQTVRVTVPCTVRVNSSAHVNDCCLKWRLPQSCHCHTGLMHPHYCDKGNSAVDHAYRYHRLCNQTPTFLDTLTVESHDGRKLCVHVKDVYNGETVCLWNIFWTLVLVV